MKVQMNSARCSGCVFYRPAITLKSGLVLDEECGRKGRSLNPDQCDGALTDIQLAALIGGKHKSKKYEKVI